MIKWKKSEIKVDKMQEKLAATKNLIQLKEKYEKVIQDLVDSTYKLMELTNGGVSSSEHLSSDDVQTLRLNREEIVKGYFDISDDKILTSFKILYMAMQGLQNNISVEDLTRENSDVISLFIDNNHDLGNFKNIHSSDSSNNLENIPNVQYPSNFTELLSMQGVTFARIKKYLNQNKYSHPEYHKISADVFMPSFSILEKIFYNVDINKAFDFKYQILRDSKFTEVNQIIYKSDIANAIHNSYDQILELSKASIVKEEDLNLLTAKQLENLIGLFDDYNKSNSIRETYYSKFINYFKSYLISPLETENKVIGYDHLQSFILKGRETSSLLFKSISEEGIHAYYYSFSQAFISYAKTHCYSKVTHELATQTSCQTNQLKTPGIMKDCGIFEEKVKVLIDHCGNYFPQHTIMDEKISQALQRTIEMNGIENRDTSISLPSKVIDAELIINSYVNENIEPINSDHHGDDLLTSTIHKAPLEIDAGNDII